MHLALLRGINVGGKASLPMKDLRAIFESAGAQRVSTFIQSGNVIFESSEPDTSEPAAIATIVTREIAARFGYPGRIILRSHAELRLACKDNPFANAGAPIASLNVYFLQDAPSAALIKTLDPDRSPGDSYVVKRREIYLNLPNGMARTKLTNAYFDTKLRTVSTARNWRTTTTLLTLMDDAAKL